MDLKQLRYFLAVAEERHRNALTRRERAAQERAEGAAFGDREGFRLEQRGGGFGVAPFGTSPFGV